MGTGFSILLHVQSGYGAGSPAVGILPELLLGAAITAALWLAWRSRRRAWLRCVARRATAVAVVIALSALIFPYDHAGVTIERSDRDAHAAHCHGNRSECSGGSSSLDTVRDVSPQREVEPYLVLDKALPAAPAVASVDGWHATLKPPPRA